MQTIAIKLHSIVDIITNSSSEIFACNFSKISEELRKFAMDILKALGNVGEGCRITQIDKDTLEDELCWHSYLIADHIPEELKEKINFKSEDDFKGDDYENYIKKLVKKHGDELAEALKYVYIIDCDQNIGLIGVFEHYFGTKK